MKLKTEEIFSGIYLIGGANATHPEDAAVYLIDFSGDLILIDAGAGKSSNQLVRNIEMLGFAPTSITHVVLTHCHIDHVGSAPFFQKRYGAKIIIHELDANPLETGDAIRTASNWYGTSFPPTTIDYKLKGSLETIKFGTETLNCLHTPGHTPGSISIYLDRNGKRVLFGQDIHGPFNDSFGSNLSDWRKSMQLLLDLKADILCEGHFGIYQPETRVRAYIERYLEAYDVLNDT
jgi:glyoxylase-like metal-dependent hydrolase (beta-lactamase superfamily II)